MTTTNKQPGRDIFYVTLVLLVIALTQCDDTERKHNNYTFGETLMPHHRAQVDALQDSTLNARKAQYKNLHQDYLVQYQGRAGNAETNKTTPIMNRKLNNPSRVAFPKYDAFPDNYFVRDYHDFLTRYERDSIEARYRELSNKLMRQR